jgi:hypothetical protein
MVMLTDLVSTDILIVVVIAVCSLIVLVYLDRFFTRQRSFLANSLYVQRLHNGRKDAALHLFGSKTRNRPFGQQANLIMGPEIEVRRPGFFSKRRVVTDTFGRVVATHYEELVISDLNNTRPQLTAGTAIEYPFEVAA